MTFECPHCHSSIPVTKEFDKIVENGNAYSQICSNCLHTVGIRPRLETDGRAPSELFTKEEVQRMRFVSWRLGDDIRDQVRDDDPYLETQSIDDQINSLVERKMNESTTSEVVS